MPTVLAASQILHGVTPGDGIHAGIILAVTIALCLMVRRVVIRAFGGDADRFIARMLARLLAYVVFMAGFVYALMAVRVQIGPLIGALGIGGIALAFALQDILQNLVAGIILQARRPIRHGDQVQLGGYTGVVRDIDLRTVLVRTFDGLDVYVPNRTVLQNPLVNYTISPHRRITLTVGVGYRTDLAAAQRLLLEAVGSVDGVLADPEPAAWVTGFATSSITFSVLLWFAVATHSMWKVQSDAAIAVKAALDRAGIAMPFPQRTLWLEPELARAVVPGGDRQGEAQAPDGAPGNGAPAAAGSSGRRVGAATDGDDDGDDEGPGGQSTRASSLR